MDNLYIHSNDQTAGILTHLLYGSLSLLFVYNIGRIDKSSIYRGIL